MGKITLLRADSPPRDIPLDKPRISVGRRSSNDIRLDDPAVSGEHAVIQRFGQETIVEDLDSTNGTRVNGQPVKKHFLQDGDVIEVATYRIVYHSVSADGAVPVTGIPILKVASGKNAGRWTALTKAISVIEGVEETRLLILRNGADYTLIAEAAPGPVRLNGELIDVEGRRLHDGDIIQLPAEELHFLSAFNAHHKS